MMIKVKRKKNQKMKYQLVKVIPIVEQTQMLLKIIKKKVIRVYSIEFKKMLIIKIKKN